MTDPIELRRYENTQRLLDSNSTEFLTPDEQMFIGQQLNKVVLRELENNSSSGAETLSSLSNLCDWLKNDGRSTSSEDVSSACDALLEKSRRLSRCKYYSEPDDSEAIYTLYGNPFAKFIDRYGALGKRAFDALEANARISAFDNFVLPEIDEQIRRARETARINAERNPGRELDGSFSEPLSESTRQNVLDNFIDLFDSNGLDSSWLRELKGADFSIFFQRKERRQCAHRRNNSSGCGKRPRRFNEREGRKKLSGNEDSASPRTAPRVATSAG